jgi:hypothetical protein
MYPSLESRTVRIPSNIHASSLLVFSGYCFGFRNEEVERGNSESRGIKRKYIEIPGNVSETIMLSG